MVEPLVLTPKLFWSIAAVPIAALAAERMATLQKKSKYEFKIHSNQYSLSHSSFQESDSSLLELHRGFFNFVSQNGHENLAHVEVPSKCF